MRGRVQIPGRPRLTQPLKLEDPDAERGEAMSVPLALLASAAMLAPAHAPAPTPDPGASARSGITARVAFGPTRCPRVRVTYDLGRGQAVGLASWKSRGDGRRFACRVQLRPALKRWPAAWRCAVLVHELGHLAGRPHSSDPRSVMYPVVRVVPRGCGHRPAGPPPSA